MQAMWFCHPVVFVEMCWCSNLNHIFNYTYYTMAHKCNMRQLLAIPASYKNKSTSKSGRLLCACLNASSILAAIFSLAVYRCADKFFCFSCCLIEFCCPPVCSCLHFPLMGKPTRTVWAAKWEWKRFYHFLAVWLLNLLWCVFKCADLV